MKRGRAAAALLALVVAGAGCAHYPVNTRLAPDAPRAGYRFPAPADDGTADKRDELFVCVSFSGGGTRAAAFAYGVLKALRDTRIDHNGLGSLLDEVDCVSGISGGSFAAAAYVLRPREFFEEFPDKFLRPDVEGMLMRSVANPVNLVRLMSPRFSRIDLAAELYDRLLFGGARFDALDPNRRPFLTVNATDMATGASFEFTQNYFDFLGSDVGSVPLSRAVAASSAFPFLLSPITVWSYPGPFSTDLPLEIKTALEDRETNLHRYRRARDLEALTTTSEKYIHLLDGGLADNIGARAIVNTFRSESGFVRVRVSNRQIRRFVVLMVNAKTAPAEQLTRSPQGPGILSVAMATATAPMDNYSVDTVELMRQFVLQADQDRRTVERCNVELAKCEPPRRPFPTLPAVRGCVIELSFEGLPGKERDELLAYPTSFSLSEGQVSRLIDAGAAVLEKSPDFQRLVRVLKSEPALGQGIGLADRCS